MAEPMNTTIDDTDPAFSFLGIDWNAITPGNPCGHCSANLDPGSTFDSSWHDGSSVGLTGSFQFEGSAVYLFGVTSAVQTAEIAFILDNGASTNYNLNTVSQSVSHVYNSLLFSSSGLSNGQHTLSWTLTSVTGPASFVTAPVHVALIDYAVVTSDIEPSPSNGPSHNTNSAISSTVTAIKSVTSTVVQTQASSGSTSTGSSIASVNSVNSSTALPSAINSALGGLTSSLSSFNTTSLTVTVSSSASSVQISSSASSSAIGGASQTKSRNKLIITAVIGSAAGAILILCIIVFVLRKRYLDRNLRDSPERGICFGIRYQAEKRRMLATAAEDRPRSVTDDGCSSTPPVTVIDPTAENSQRQGTERLVDSNGQIQQIEQRLNHLERILQSPSDNRPVSFTSPPPY